MTTPSSGITKRGEETSYPSKRLSYVKRSHIPASSVKFIIFWATPFLQNRGGAYIGAPRVPPPSKIKAVLEQAMIMYGERRHGSMNY